MKVNSTIKMNIAALNRLTKAQVKALEMTTEALHTEVVQAKVVPFGPKITKNIKVYGKRGQFAKNGREYKGKTKKIVVRSGGTLQGDAFSADYADSSKGKTSLTHSTPYARRLYFHPEYNFTKETNPNAKGEWFEDWKSGGKKADFAPKTFKKFYKKITGV